MQALLLSPATRFLSPDSSSSLSPSTPPLPSLDFLSLDPDNSTRQTDTPSHPSSSTSTTRRLVQSPTPTPTLPHPLPASNTTLPRVPSNLRYQYNPSQSLSYPDTVNNAQSQELNHSTFHFINSPPQSHSPPPPDDTSLQLIDFHQPSSQPHSPNTSTTSSPSSDAQGTFIYNSVIVNSTRQVPGGVGEGGGNDQLAAAIRAFRTPKSAGLFEGEEEESSLNDEEGGEEGEGWNKMGNGLLGGKGAGAGLMSLFEPLLEEKEMSTKHHVPLPRSTRPAPSLSQFSFVSSSPQNSQSLPFAHHTPLVFHPTQTPSTAVVQTPSFSLLGGNDESDSQSTPLANIPALIATPQPQPQSLSLAGGGGKKGKALYGDIGGEKRTPGIFTRTRGVAEEPIAGPGRKERFLKRSVSVKEERKEEEEEEGNFSTTEEEFESAKSREYRESLLLYPTKSEDDDSSSSDDEDGGQGGLSEESEPLSASGGRGEGVFIGVEGMTERELRENGFMSTSEEENHSSSSSESAEEVQEGQEEGEGFSSQEEEEEVGGQSVQNREEEEVGGQSVQNRSDQRDPLQSSHPHSHSHSHLAPPPPPPPLSHHQLLPASPLRLFQSTYDTYTRNHLNEIVDLVIDSTTPPEEGDSNSSEEGFLGEEGRVRSSKRIRLSPPSPPSGSGRSTIRYSDREEEQDEETPIKKGDRQFGWGESGERSRRSRRRRSSSNTTATTMRSRRRSIGGGGRRNDATTPFLRDRKFVEASGEEAEEEERKERVRDRKSEATELMEKIRKRSEEREIRRKGLKSSNEETASSESLDSTTTTNTKTLPASPRKISISSANRSPLPLTPSLLNSNASPPPPLAHLAAAATASLRSVLGSPAPAPSPRIPSSSSSSTRQQQRTVGLGFSREFPSSIVKGLEKGGTITGGGGGGKRVFSIASPLIKHHQEEGTSIVPQATPGHKRRTSLTTIHPSSIDAQRLLASVVGSSKDGKGMQFDSEMGRWIRTPNRKRIVSTSTTTQGVVVEEKEEEEEEEEEDPFKDFSELQSPPQSQSLHSSQPLTINEPPRSQSHLQVPPLPSPSIPPSPVSTLSRADLDHLPLPGDGSGSLKLHHFDLSGLGISKGTPPLLVPPSTKDSQQLDKSPEGACYFDSQPEEKVAEIGETPLLRLEEELEEEEDSASWGEERLPEKKELVEPRPRPSLSPSPPLLLRSHSEPPPLPPTTPSHIQHTQSAPPSTSTPFPPRSALKPCRAQTDPTGFHTSSTNLVASLTSTPIRAGQGVQEPKLPRSVSFSDGKRHGKIRGLESWEKDKDKGSKLRYEVGKASLKTSGAVDLDGQGGAFGELEMDESVADAEESWEVDEKEQEQERRDEAKSVTDDTPRASQSRQSSRVSEPSEETSLVLSSFDSASPAHHRSSASHTASASRSRTFSRTANSRNGTFLTECSFGVSHDRLLQYITDVEPFEPDWEGLTSIDLSGKRAESVVRLKEFLPRLDEVNLNHNEISYLTGIPSTLRTLLIASNRLTSLTSFNHLHNLERLDLSNNQLDSVQHLSALRHLRDLKVDGNQITTIEGLGELDGLVRLSLKGNQLTGDVDLGKTKWSRLETLHLAHNRIESLTGLEQLHSLTSMNLDHNSLTSLDPPSSLTRLRILRLCNNPISHIDVSFAPKLRTIYIDSARLGVVQGTEHLRKLENLSVRDQSGAALTLAMPHIRDVKRLYLSGNPLPSSFPSEKFFNLTYLELAMCQLTSLPPNLASLVPNVRTLNLDFNFLESLEPLRGLTRLGKLSVVGARLNKVRPVVGVLESLVELESLDMRMNPITLAFYPPLGPVTDSLLPSHREHRILHPDSLPSSSTTTTVATSSITPDFTTLDSKFRKALPDEWYFKRSAYRAALMHAVPSLIKLDGIDCTRERKKVRKVIEKLRGGDHEA
ncbi:hypothetical protein JCM5353_003027 [Sporobolomyces roseus]